MRFHDPSTTAAAVNSIMSSIDGWRPWNIAGVVSVSLPAATSCRQHVNAQHRFNCDYVYAATHHNAKRDDRTRRSPAARHLLSRFCRILRCCGSAADVRTAAEATCSSYDSTTASIQVGPKSKPRPLPNNQQIVLKYLPNSIVKEALEYYKFVLNIVWAT